MIIYGNSKSIFLHANKVIYSSAHLLDECEQKDKYVECDICGEAVLENELQKHQNNKKICIPRKPGKVSTFWEWVL